MIPVLEGAIDRIDSLSKDVQINSLMKQWNEVFAAENKEMVNDQKEKDEIAMVSENERQYGADAFEEYMKKQAAMKTDLKNKKMEYRLNR